jgi:predicted ArsR family transcriptional regulator
MKNKAIAEELFITETTVRHHLTSIFNKLAVTTRLELVIFAFKHNLVKTPRASEPFGLAASNSNGFQYV